MYFNETEDNWVRLLPKEKQEEYQRLKKIIEEKEREKLTKKAGTNKQTRNIQSQLQYVLLNETSKQMQNMSNEELNNKTNVSEADMLKNGRSTSLVEETRQISVTNGASKNYSKISIVQSQRYKKEFVSHDHDYDFPRKRDIYSYNRNKMSASEVVSNPPHKEVKINQELSSETVVSSQLPDDLNMFKYNVEKYLEDIVTKCKSKKHTEKKHLEISSVENLSEASDDATTPTCESGDGSISFLKENQEHSSVSSIASTTAETEYNKCSNQGEERAQEVEIENGNSSEQFNYSLDPAVPKNTNTNEDKDIEILEILEISVPLEIESRPISKDVVLIDDTNLTVKPVKANEANFPEPLEVESRPISEDDVSIDDTDPTEKLVEMNEVNSPEPLGVESRPISEDIVLIDDTDPIVKLVEVNSPEPLGVESRPISEDVVLIDDNDPTAKLVEINEFNQGIDDADLKAIPIEPNEVIQDVLIGSRDVESNDFDDNLVDLESQCSESSRTLICTDSNSLSNEDVEKCTVDQDSNNDDSCSSEQAEKRFRIKAVQEQLSPSSSVGTSTNAVEALTSNRDLLFEKRFDLIEELSQMSESLGELEREQSQLDKVIIEISTLRKALLKAEERLHLKYISTCSLDEKVHVTQQSLYDRHLHIQQLETTCQQLGSSLHGQQYQIPTKGQELMIKKIQQICKKKEIINSKRKVLKEYLQNPDITKEEFENLYAKHNPKNNKSNTKDDEVLKTSLLELPNISQITASPLKQLVSPPSLVKSVTEPLLLQQQVEFSTNESFGSTSATPAQCSVTSTKFDKDISQHLHPVSPKLQNEITSKSVDNTSKRTHFGREKPMEQNTNISFVKTGTSYSGVSHPEVSEITASISKEISLTFERLSSELLTHGRGFLLPENQKKLKRSNSDLEDSPTSGNKRPKCSAENKSSCGEKEIMNVGHLECMDIVQSIQDKHVSNPAQLPVDLDVGEKAQENNASKPADFSEPTNKASPKSAKSLLAYKSVRPNSDEA